MASEIDQHHFSILGLRYKVVPLFLEINMRTCVVPSADNALDKKAVGTLKQISEFFCILSCARYLPKLKRSLVVTQANDESPMRRFFPERFELWSRLGYDGFVWPPPAPAPKDEYRSEGKG